MTSSIPAGGPGSASNITPSRPDSPPSSLKLPALQLQNLPTPTPTASRPQDAPLNSPLHNPPLSLVKSEPLDRPSTAQPPDTSPSALSATRPLSLQSSHLPQPAQLPATPQPHSSPSQSADGLSNSLPQHAPQLSHPLDAASVPQQMQQPSTSQTPTSNSHQPGQGDNQHLDGLVRQSGQRLRSSIACQQCRKDKTKCTNSGLNTTCTKCFTNGRQCTYSAPAAIGSGSAARRESFPQPLPSATSLNSQGQMPRRARPTRKAPMPLASTSASSHKASPLTPGSALDAEILTPQVWLQLWEIHQTHFSSDILFLSTPEFTRPLKKPANRSRVDAPRNDLAPSPIRPPGSPALLLTFLALTARHHPDLVSHLWNSRSKAEHMKPNVFASEYYAREARAEIFAACNDYGAKPTLEQVQALIMLAYHEWTMCQGKQARTRLGVAILMAQDLGLHIEPDLDDKPQARMHTPTTEALSRTGLRESMPDSTVQSLDTKQRLMEQEIRRRTFWSCFILDRCMGCGKFRTPIIRIDEVKIQLPCSQRSFTMREQVKTRLLDANLEKRFGSMEGRSKRKADEMLDSSKKVRWEVGANEGMASRYIRLMELFNRILRWSCTGGRRTEEPGVAPWEEASMFRSLRKELDEFVRGLPEDLERQDSNLRDKLADQQGTTYMVLHIVLLFCSIMLHREYVPFIPLKSTRPEGPLDEPTFPSESYTVPSGFWETSAAELFTSSHDIVDLLQMFQEAGALVESPMVAFAIYAAAFTGVYAIAFPHMDPRESMCKGKFTDRAMEFLGSMECKFKMAEHWIRFIKRSIHYLNEVKREVHQKNLPLDGGGLDTYIDVWENLLKDPNYPFDEDEEMPDADSDPPGARPVIDDRSDSGSAARELTEEPREVASAHQGGWNAVNTVPAAVRSENKPATPSIPNGMHNQLHHPFSSADQPSTPNQPDGSAQQASAAIGEQIQRLAATTNVDFGGHDFAMFSYGDNPEQCARANVQQHDWVSNVYAKSAFSLPERAL